MKIQKVKEWKESKTQQFKVIGRNMDNKVTDVIRLKDNKPFSIKYYGENLYFSKLEIPGLHISVFVGLRIGMFCKDLTNVTLHYMVLDIVGHNVLGDSEFLFHVCPINEIEKAEKEFKELDLKSFLKKQMSQINKNFLFFETH